MQTTWIKIFRSSRSENLMFDSIHTSILKLWHKTLFSVNILRNSSWNLALGNGCKYQEKPCLCLETASLAKLCLDVQMAVLHPSIEISGKQQWNTSTHICRTAYIIQIHWWIFYLTTCRCFIIAARTKTSLRATWIVVHVANRIKSGSKYLFVSAVAFWPLFGDLHCIDNSIKPMACLRKSS